MTESIAAMSPSPNQTPLFALCQQASLGQIKQFDMMVDGKRLQVQQILRQLPHRRVVMWAHWAGQAVVVKAFLGKQAMRYAQRDVQGIRLFQQQGILTPDLLYQWDLSAQQLVLVIYQALNDTLSASDFFVQSHVPQRQQLLIQLSRLLGKQHQLGLWQQDLHGSNFLVQLPLSQTETRLLIYSIDGDGVKQVRTLAMRKSLQQLAILLGKFDVLQLMPCLPECLHAYCQQRAWRPLSPAEMQDFIQTMRQLRLDMLSAYADKKVFRDCSDVRTDQVGSHHFTINRQLSLSTAQLLTALQQGFAAASAQAPSYLKQGNTCSIVRYRLPPQAADAAPAHWVIKRYNIKNFWHGLQRGLRRSRAAVSWSNAHRLQLLAIPTPKPIALVEKRMVGWQRQAYYISQYIEGISLRQLSQAKLNQKQMQQAVTALADLFQRLYLVGIAHGDCKADNLMWHTQQWWLLDLDSMRQILEPKTALAAHVRDLKRLFANWNPEDRLYNVMLSAFAARYADHTPLLLAELPLNPTA